MTFSLKSYDKTSGSLVVTHFGEYTTRALAKNALDANVLAKNNSLSYNLELFRTDDYDGYNSSDARATTLSVGYLTEYRYVRSDTKKFIYTIVSINDDYPNYTVSGHR